MIFFLLFYLGVIAAVLAVVVFAAAFLFIRKPPAGPNRFGAASRTRNVLQAIISGFLGTFDFRGRVSRMDFWSFAIFVAGLAFMALAGLVAAWIMLNSGIDYPAYAVPLALTILLIAAMIGVLIALACLSMAVRRLHDINKSGGWLLLLFVFGYFVLLYWFFQPSQKDETAEVF